jgi:UDP-N-acetylglucosamine diphosphorylase / glucose-1-phosphate thymidylyltransferase / UDP-N-acetylgalactosamine diphosphorylase / glucosamine-1-phosphate N-acetyltransferase / galactosamine-1-phosphate N-acetyltransferase
MVFCRSGRIGLFYQEFQVIMNINIIIPMAGAGSRFADAGYTKPKPFIDVLGKPMIVRVLENLACENAKYIFIAMDKHLEQEKELVKQLQHDYPVIFNPIGHLTEGAACTVLHAREFINNDEPMIIANSDQIVDIHFQDYVNDCLERDLDGSIMTFNDTEKSTKWSFAKTNSAGLVEEVREKTPISNLATVGIYMFRKGRDYVDAAVDMIVQNDRVNNEFYVCPVYNYTIKNGNRIGVFEIPLSAMHGLGTPTDLNTYIGSLKL